MSPTDTVPLARRGTTIPLSIAPMMDRTDRHCRFFLRQLSRRTLLYTEMITSRAILHGKRDDLLDYHPCEHPIALQLGGDDPAELARHGRPAILHLCKAQTHTRSKASLKIVESNNVRGKANT